ncbi:bifunctional DNA-formamidopyrimidine glycosylase/DNA-(apurinic or apyrimidinic site) lyase [uncultured Anaerovibrio sp.]|uniref:bifunctional DNA-formamidopyrimidine glycosylase/DNA-(apurinic or apyrimidinic site) lyase n=1 Tax=uncultured Anaerovibrio sp. TaxID=361586 RepID=UPI002604ECD3|nr:bifunctional DNA-formamidopyrimidine glycosylase/DNA-(apurinic or apyrimidinic site) lyase [uncultured Anaerovibrio sp.]
MPEMPELETIKRSLEPNLIGKKIKRIEILLDRQIKWPTPGEFMYRLLFSSIEKLERRGKYLIMKTTNDFFLIFHLRMTGQVIYCPKGESLPDYGRIIFDFSDGSKLVYADSRTLGTIYVMNEKELPQIKGLAELGPEPLSEAFTLAYLQKILAAKRGSIKTFLLDQSNIAGLGNIYVDEALFLAGIHPMTSPDSIEEDQAEALFAAINKVIEDGINDGGTTFRDYRDGNGEKGSHQEHLYAYGRGGKPCLKCGTIMKKIKVGGRGTVFCPACQQLK